MLENTVWLTQLEIAELFGKGRSTIAEHISAIFEDRELESSSVCRKFRQTADDGKLKGQAICLYNSRQTQQSIAKV
jgi:hypothetical protein